MPGRQTRYDTSSSSERHTGVEERAALGMDPGEMGTPAAARWGGTGPLRAPDPIDHDHPRRCPV